MDKTARKIGLYNDGVLVAYTYIVEQGPCKFDYNLLKKNSLDRILFCFWACSSLPNHRGLHTSNIRYS